MVFQRKRLTFNPQNPYMPATRWDLGNFLLGWLSRTSRTHQSDGSSLLHGQQPGLRMALKDAQVRLHLLCTNTTYTHSASQQGAEQEELCFVLPTHISLCHTGFTIQEDEFD